MKKIFFDIKGLSKKRVIYNLILVTITALLIETVVLSLFNYNTNIRTTTILANQVSTVLKSNDVEEENLLDSLKSEYKVRAKAVAYYLDKNSDTYTDKEELKKIANLLEIDEINIFDEEGTIISGTVPEYYGMNMDDGTQISYFKPMLEDKSLSMCQNVTPNTANSEEIMYAITWNNDGTQMVQVGIHPVRMVARLKANDIEVVVSNMPEYQGYNIYVADIKTKEIVGATSSGKVGLTWDKLDLGLSQQDFTDNEFKTINSGGFITYVKCMASGEYAIIISHSTRYDIPRLLIVELIIIIYLLLAAYMIYNSVSALISSNNDKERQLSILISMADVYYSMHLIDLEHDRLREYKAQFEVKDIVNHQDGATKMMIDTMKQQATEETLNQILVFSDLTTVAQRMKDKKIITSEFIGRRIGWTQASFITLKADADGIPTEVMFTTRCIEDEKKKEDALIRRSNTDELTQLYNRRAFEHEVNSLDLSYDNLVYAEFDVNGLKNINDTLGHAAGDELIIGAASCIRDIFGQYGKVFRTGGDEYVAIFHASNNEVDRLKIAFDGSIKAWHGNLVEHLSISSGYVRADEKVCKDIKEMAILADHRMYESKAFYYKQECMDRRSH